MTIIVKFMGTLARELFRNPSLTHAVLELPEGSRVKDLFERYKIPPDREYVAIINGRVAGPDEILSSGATVLLFQSAYGG